MTAELLVLDVTVGGDVNCGGVVSGSDSVGKVIYVDVAGPFPAASVDPTVK
jgi:hypothetical protein